jgi:hypothetical protein
MENGLGHVHWLHGLTDYFEFTNEQESKHFVEFLLKLLYADKPVIKTTDESGMSEFIHTLRKYANSAIIDVLYKYYREGYDPLVLQDAFSRGQVQSKIWLTEELQKVNEHFDTIYHLGGWYGQLTWYFDKRITFNKYRNFDIDIEACKVSDYIINLQHLEGYKAKSVQLGLPLWDDSDEERNMNWITRTGCEYEIKNYSNGNVFREKTQPNLIINTSAEHMPSIWFDKFVNRPQPTDPMFVIQTNNLFDANGHVNCVHSVDHMIKKFNMSRIEYAGELQLTGYKRFMLIGRP